MECNGIPVAAKFITNNDEVYSAFADVPTFTYIKRGAIKLYSENESHSAQQGDCFLTQAYADLKAKRILDPVSGGFESLVFVIYNQEAVSIDNSVTEDKSDSSFLKLKSENLTSLFLNLDSHFLLQKSISSTKCAELRAAIDKDIFLTTSTQLVDMLNTQNQLFRKFLYDHITQNLTIDKLAAKVGMSTSTFQRFFRKEMGVTPYQWIKDQRLHYARCEMQFKQVPASKIYLELGFEDLAHFSREFKKKFGYGPKQHYDSASIEFISE